MKTLYSTILVALLVLASQSSFAQGFVFKVLANKGENQVKPKDSAWEPLKTGGTLNSGDELKVSQNSYLGLVHSSGKTLELSTAGDFDVNELASSLSSGGSSVASKYADFVLNSMKGSAEVGNNQQATGSVSRELNFDSFGDENAPSVFSPSSVEAYNANTIVRWSKPKNVEDPTYVVQIRNMFDEVVFSSETKETGMKIELSEEFFTSQRLVILNVLLKDNDEAQSGDIGIRLLGGEEAQGIKNELSSISAELNSESALNQLLLASFYEKHSLILDAIACYEKAIRLAPEVEDFKSMYIEFLIRNNLGK